MSKQSELTQFFKQTKEQPKIIHVETVQTITKQFYKDCLKEKKQCENELCIGTKHKINRTREEIQQKIRKTEEAIRCCSTILSKKDAEIARLRKQISVNQNEPLSSITSQPVSITRELQEKEQEKILFNSFSMDFTENELATLRSIGATNREDSTFIAASVKFLYKNNLSILKEKSLTGRSAKPGHPKEPITPKKIEILSKIFKERVDSVANDDIENGARNKCLNKYIKNAIANINRTLLSKQTEKNACKNLQEKK